MPSYIAAVQLSYTNAKGEEQVIEEGQPANAVPAQSIPWLIDQGKIVEAQEGSKASKGKMAEPAAQEEQ